MVKNSSQVMSSSPSQAPARRRQTISAEQIRNYIRDSRSELRKVTWPTPEQTRNLTLVVIAVCAGMAVFLGIVDLLLGALVKLIVGY